MKSIVSSSLTLTLSSLVSKGILFGALILMARAAGPELLSQYNAAFSVLVLFGILSKMGLDNVLIIKSNQGIDREGIFRVLNSIRRKIAFAFFVIFILYGIHNFQSYIFLALGTLIITGGSISSGSSDFLLAYHKSKKNFKVQLYFDFVRALVLGLVVFGFYIIGKLTINIFVIGIVLSSLIGFYFIRKSTNNLIVQGGELDLKSGGSSGFLLMGLHFCLVSFLFELSNRLAFVLGIKYVSEHELGLYSAAFQVYAIGYVVISNVGIVLLPNMAANYKDSGYLRRMLKNMVVVASSMMVVLLVAYPLIEVVFHLLYGVDYKGGETSLLYLLAILPIRLLSLWAHQIIESYNHLIYRYLIFGAAVLTNLLMIMFWETSNIMSKSLFYSNVVLAISAFLTVYYIKKNEKIAL